MREVTIRSQWREAVADAKLSDQRINGPGLHAPPATAISKFSGQDVILPVGRDQRNAAESLDQDLRLLWPAEPLQQLLQNKTSGLERLSGFEGMLQDADICHIRHMIAPQGKRPNGGVDKQRHLRDRSAL